MVSIIVPVYNASVYLRLCIDSVLRQDYTDLELLLVDDGSTDDSSAICKKFAEKDNRIEYVRTENRGACHARNVGLDICKGEYVMFLDADDELRQDCLTACLQKMQSESVDLVCAECQSIYPDGKEYSSKRPTFEEQIIDSETYLKKILAYDTLCSIWAKLYKREFIGDGRFMENAKRGQDVLFWTTILPATNYKVLLMPQVVYNYRILNDSVSHGKAEQQIGKIRNLIGNLLLQKKKSSANLAKYFNYAVFLNIKEIVQWQGIHKYIDDELFGIFKNIVNDDAFDFDIEEYWRKAVEAINARKASSVLTRALFVNSCMSKFKRMVKSIVR